MEVLVITLLHTTPAAVLWHLLDQAVRIVSMKSSPQYRADLVAMVTDTSRLSHANDILQFDCSKLCRIVIQCSVFGIIKIISDIYS